MAKNTYFFYSGLAIQVDVVIGIKTRLSWVLASAIIMCAHTQTISGSHDILIYSQSLLLFQQELRPCQLALVRRRITGMMCETKQNLL